MDDQRLSVAVQLMENWAAAPDDSPATVGDVLGDVDATPVEAVGGLVTLAGILLVRLQQVEGSTPEDTLYSIREIYDA